VRHSSLNPVSTARCWVLTLGWALACLAPVAPSRAEPACPQAGSAKESLLFLSDRPGGKRNGNWDVYRADLSGERVERLTDFPKLSIRWFDKDPQRSRLVIAASSRGNLSVGPSGPDGGPAAAEEVLAVVDEGARPRKLIDLRPGGHNPENFTSLWHPTFSPDGSRIVFAADKRGESNNLWIVNDDGTGLRRIAKDPQRTQNDPRFTPDGRVVYVRHEKSGLAQLVKPNLLDVWLIDPDRPTANRRLTAESKIPGPPLVETDPAVSPDCARVAMIRAVAPVSLGSLLKPLSANAVMKVKGKARRFRLMQAGTTPDRTHGVPTWIDAESLLSYRWETEVKAWRVIRFEANADDGDVSVMDLGAPTGSSDLLPLAY